MPNKSLDRFLFTDAQDNTEPLTWGTRLMIMIGTARGLAYLHSTNLIHCDLSSSHVLLDEDYNAKLGDFGLAKYGHITGETLVSTGFMGTMDYAAPEYIRTGLLSMKCDIYSFGVVMLENISGRSVLDHTSSHMKKNLVKEASRVKLNRSKLKKIMDPRLQHNYPLQGAFEYFSLALRCLKKKPKDRPSSEEVLQNLEQIYALHN